MSVTSDSNSSRPGRIECVCERENTKTGREERERRREKTRRKESNQASGHPGEPKKRENPRNSRETHSCVSQLPVNSSPSNWLWLMYPSVPSDAAPKKGRARLRGWNYTHPNGDNCQRIRPTYAGRSRQHNPISECCRPGSNKVEKNHSPLPF